VPLPVATGEPEEAFPFPWSIVRWVPGEVATLHRLSDPVQAARDLAAFVLALRAVDATGGPAHRRGSPVRLQDDEVRRGVAGLRGEVDGEAVVNMWNRVVAAPDYEGPPVWFHGHLSYLNLLARGGELSGVIDWGACGVGDPAIDAIVAWSLFPADARDVYREALGVDDATWERGKGWVLTGVFGIPYYRDTDPVLVVDKITAINAVLATSS
jgi:aminoglycoside phosphotransferase (APT) family kinase protein